MINYVVVFNKSRIIGKFKFIYEIVINLIRLKVFFEIGNVLLLRLIWVVCCQFFFVQRIIFVKVIIYYLIIEFKDLKKLILKYK